MTFDARAMKLLQAGQHLTSPEFPGLRLEATEHFRTWTYRYKSPIDGRMRQTKLGRWPAMSLHAAVAEWEKLRASREAGGDPALEAKQARAAGQLARSQAVAARAQSSYTVAALCNDYYEGYVRLSRAKKGADEVRRMFATMLGAFGDMAAAEVTRSHAFDLIQSYAAATPVQAKKLRSELGAAWDYAIDAGRLPDSVPNWWRLILRGKIKSKGKMIAGERVGTTKRVLSPDEIGALVRWLPNFTALVEDALTLYLWTGTRGAEIVAMEGREVRQEAGGIWWWTIPKAKTKNARHEGATDLRVPLFGRAQSVVLRRKERFGDGWLFPSKTRDGKLTHTEQKSIQVAVYYHQPYSTTRPESERARLSVTHWAPHDLRRSARTLLAAMGCPSDVAESVLGHMIPGVAGVYNRHQYDAERVEWLRRLADRLEELARFQA
ncbi:tyrosine-type recombinase/integrase [Thauera humireducens]|uniref:Alpha/beta hydrolase n=1 Tax=Thauera humireducens TaxID=1134435 RepID=A0A127K3B3_9RHOO|nr:integrase family protein [Thauera humireducens]AMO36447.1 alpha/beta hydrolase [Thauera humireducens]